uniref:Uncharacterized protein n=1 Tax=Glossina palpalis gambiensis TaxID=67801 RepID=A0A1B0BRR0_9MUSC
LIVAIGLRVNIVTTLSLHCRADLLPKVSGLQQHFRFILVFREDLTNKGLANKNRQAIITNFDKMLCCMKITLLIATSAIAVEAITVTEGAAAAAAAAAAAQKKKTRVSIRSTDGRR